MNSFATPSWQESENFEFKEGLLNTTARMKLMEKIEEKTKKWI